MSNLHFLSRVLKKIVAKRLRYHLTKCKLYEPHQSAYRQHHNAETALVKMQNNLLWAAGDSKVSILSLLYLSAAFDTTDPSIFIERLPKTFGLAGNILNWFKS